MINIIQLYDNCFCNNYPMLGPYTNQILNIEPGLNANPKPNLKPKRNPNQM